MRSRISRGSRRKEHLARVWEVEDMVVVELDASIAMT